MPFEDWTDGCWAGVKLKYIRDGVSQMGHKPLSISHYIQITILWKYLNFDPFYRTTKKGSRGESLYLRDFYSYFRGRLLLVVELKLCSVFYCIKIEISCYHNRTPSLHFFGFFLASTIYMNFFSVTQTKYCVLKARKMCVRWPFRSLSI